MKSRALRRHHRKRIWRKRRHYYGGATGPYAWLAGRPRKRMLINTPKLCNGICCSRKKQRAVGELSHQERRALSVADEQLQSWWKDGLEIEQASDDRVEVPRDKAV